MPPVQLSNTQVHRGSGCIPFGLVLVNIDLESGRQPPQETRHILCQTRLQIYTVLYSAFSATLKCDRCGRKSVRKLMLQAPIPPSRPDRPLKPTERR